MFTQKNLKKGDKVWGVKNPDHTNIALVRASRAEAVEALDRNYTLLVELTVTNIQESQMCFIEKN